MAASPNASVNILIAVTALGALLYILYMYSQNSAAPALEGMTNMPAPGDQMIPSDPAAASWRAVDYPEATNGVPETVPNDCFPKDRLDPEDLLPKDAANDKWAQVNPAGQGGVADQNFLNAGHHAGVNTVAGSLRNANLSIRSEPPNPRARVSPWMESTIEPDLNRRAFEIGSSGSC